ncbi:MAG: T9SS type A sorting domain-containing protein [Ferruginibacter sp.]
MKYKLLLSASLISASFFCTAQTASKTFAITGKANNNFFWADIKQVDLTTGKVNKVFFEADKTTFKNNNIDKSAIVARSNEINNPTGLGVAACALDTRHNRLYFATMHFSDIRYLDLNSDEASFTTVKRNVISSAATKDFQPEENHITRMVIAADGYGYALSNDANHLVRFSTSNNPSVEDLGNLVDAENNKGISIHNKCTSWGGDMVADAFGKLVVISANHNVFNVDVKNRVASFAGTITGLPVNFSTNGAAVDDDGNLVVSSANVFEGLYKVNIKDFSAVKVVSKEQAFNASDLANGNLLSQKEANDLMRFDYTRHAVLNGDGKVYPNPLTGNQFNVVFDGQPAGKYTILLTDVAGRSLQSKVVNISKASQVESVRVTGKTAKGMYLVKVLNGSKQLAFSEKVVIQ